MNHAWRKTNVGMNDTLVESVGWIQLILSSGNPARTTWLLITWPSPRDKAQDLSRSYTLIITAASLRPTSPVFSPSSVPRSDVAPWMESAMALVLREVCRDGDYNICYSLRQTGQTNLSHTPLHHDCMLITSLHRLVGPNIDESGPAEVHRSLRSPATSTTPVL